MRVGLISGVEVAKQFQANHELFVGLRDRATQEREHGIPMPTFPVHNREPVLFQGGQSENCYLGIPVKAADGYHRSARYTPEENIKITNAVNLLTDIAEGRYQINAKAETFAERIERNFTSQSNSRKVFAQAVADSMFECFETFGKLYPEEIPSLHAVFQTAGSAGSVLVLILSVTSLKDAIDGTLNEGNMANYKIPSREQFIMPKIGQHEAPVELFDSAFFRSVFELSPQFFSAMGLTRETLGPSSGDGIAKEIGTEKKCSGARFAKALLRETAKAACTLSKNKDVTDFYRFNEAAEISGLDNGIDNCMRRVQGYIDTMFKEAEEKYMTS